MELEIPLLIPLGHLIIGRCGVIDGAAAHQVVAPRRDGARQLQGLPAMALPICAGLILQVPAGQVHLRGTGIVQLHKAVAGRAVVAAAIDLVHQNMGHPHVIDPLGVVGGPHLGTLRGAQKSPRHQGYRQCGGQNAGQRFLLPTLSHAVFLSFVQAGSGCLRRLFTHNLTHDVSPSWYRICRRGRYHFSEKPVSNFCGIPFPP